jgi:hypothetical protein
VAHASLLQIFREESNRTQNREGSVANREYLASDQSRPLPCGCGQDLPKSDGAWWRPPSLPAAFVDLKVASHPRWRATRLGLLRECATSSLLHSGRERV